MILLVVTATLFPLLYLTLELPKRIINDAVDSPSDVIAFFGLEFNQVAFLAVLCAAFLLSVLAHGMLKMRINTMKGVLAERLLRRFRYQLINQMLRFPNPYFQRTSQGELVSMITSESEPLGGLMGDALAQPVLQAGQMLTILSFLFFQSFWFGLAAVALIPLQAWLIPKLQHQVNLLNKKRIIEVRQLAAEIGENAAGASTLRTNGGWGLRMAMITERLGQLFEIRFQIYQKKFFMKFINNFITQLTPFFFFSVGGYLVIQEKVSLGALVAALAAYKDLSAPWKELLTYYNQVQDMSLRWQTIIERFAPKSMVDETLFEGQPDDIPRLTGDIKLENITVRDEHGTPVLQDLNLTFSKASAVAVSCSSESDRRALAELLIREISPASGKVTIADHDLASLHQRVIAARIGLVSAKPYIFRGTVGENVMMPLRVRPPALEAQNTLQIRNTEEAKRAGNSPDTLSGDWLDPGLACMEDEDAIGDWWLELVEGIGSGNALFRRGLDQKFTEAKHPELAQRLVELRPKIAKLIAEAGLDKLYFRFDKTKYNPALPLGGNILYATPHQTITQEALAAERDFLGFLQKLNLETPMLNLSFGVLSTLSQTFGTDGTDHPLFIKLGIDPDIYEQMVDALAKSQDLGLETLTQMEKALVLTTPFRISAEQIGPAFSESLKEDILKLRMGKAEALTSSLNHLFEPLDEARFAPGLTVLENVIFGKISGAVGSKADELKKLVAEVLLEEGLKRQVAGLIYDFETEISGANMSGFFIERVAFNRAAIKRPDIMIMDHALISYDASNRLAAAQKLRKMMPETTLIYIENNFEDPDQFDMHIEIENGRIKDGTVNLQASEENMASADLAKKLRVLESADLFTGLARKQLRLLAFGAQWYTATKGDYIFHKNDDTSDGVYLLLKGEAGLYYPYDNSEDELISTVSPGRLVGDSALFTNNVRPLDMCAHTDIEALRIGKEEFLSVVEHDAATAYKLLQTVSGYMIEEATRARMRTDKVTHNS